jgi:transposase-like protein
MDLFSFFDFINDSRKLIDYLIEKNILLSHCFCYYCGYEMLIKSRSNISDGYVFRCRNCERMESIRKGSWFMDQFYSRLSLSKLLMIIYLWSNEIPVEKAVILSGVSKKTIIDYYNMMRGLCSESIMKITGQCYGGIGKYVEIDETFIGKIQKYQKGMIQKQRANLIGIIDRSSGECHIEIVEGKGEEELIPIILKYVKQGTTICTDGLATYKILKQHGYHHKMVNHSIGQYVDKKDPMNHTQTIEGMWGNLKNKFKQMHGTTYEMLPSYLDEFMWRKKYNKFEDILKLFEIKR